MLSWGPRIGASLAIVCQMTVSPIVVAERIPVVDNFIRGLEQVDHLLFRDSDSFRIVYAREKSEALGPKGNLARAEWIVAHKGKKWLVEQRFLPPYEDDDGEDRRVYLSDGEKALDWTPINRRCGIVPFGDGSNMYAGTMYFRFMGIDANRYIAASGGANYRTTRKQKHFAFDLDHPFQPETMQQNSGRYRVLPQPEDVEGHACWVVEWSGMDRMWIDIAHGYAIRQRSITGARENR